MKARIAYARNRGACLASHNSRDFLNRGAIDVIDPWAAPQSPGVGSRRRPSSCPSGLSQAIPLPAPRTSEPLPAAVPVLWGP